MYTSGLQLCQKTYLGCVLHSLFHLLQPVQFSFYIVLRKSKKLINIQRLNKIFYVFIFPVWLFQKKIQSYDGARGYLLKTEVAKADSSVCMLSPTFGKKKESLFGKVKVWLRCKAIHIPWQSYGTPDLGTLPCCCSDRRGPALLGNSVTTLFNLSYLLQRY